MCFLGIKKQNCIELDCVYPLFVLLSQEYVTVPWYLFSSYVCTTKVVCNSEHIWLVVVFCIVVPALFVYLLRTKFPIEHNIQIFLFYFFMLWPFNPMYEEAEQKYIRGKTNSVQLYCLSVCCFVWVNPGFQYI